MYALFADQIEEEDDEYTDEFKAELDEIEASYDRGEEMVSAEEAKERIHCLRYAKKSL